MTWSRLPAQSTADEWYAMGKNLFSKSLFAQAASCFEKANRQNDHNIARAYQKRKEAKAISRADARKIAFRSAAFAFESCATVTSKGTPTLRRRAAECFVYSEDFSSAATNFELAHDYTDAAIHYHKAHLLKDVVRLVRPPDGSNSLVEEDIRGRLLDNIRIQYLRVHDFEYVLKFVTRRFKSTNP